MSDIDISEPLSDLLAPLNNEQREFLMNNYTIQTYKKNETIYCEGETPSHLMCLITGKTEKLVLFEIVSRSRQTIEYSTLIFTIEKHQYVLIDRTFHRLHHADDGILVEGETTAAIATCSLFFGFENR